jgi:hypothetical protein
MFRRLTHAALVVLAGMTSLGLGVESPERPNERYGTPGRADLTGKWILTMPVGVQWNATIEKRCRCGHVELRCGAVLLQGQYELNGNRLVMVSPQDEKMVGLVWEMRNANLLELKEHPATSQFGSDYRGAVLVRRIEEDRPLWTQPAKSFGHPIPREHPMRDVEPRIPPG